MLVLRLISYAKRARERRQTCLFLKFNLITQTNLQLLDVQHNFCSVMFYTVINGKIDFIDLGNNIVTIIYLT